MTTCGTIRGRPGVARVGGVSVKPHQVVLDVLLAVAVGLLGLYAATEPSAVMREPGWVTALAGLTLGVPIAVRRRWPLGTAAAAVAATAVWLATEVVPDYASLGAVAAAAVALYTVGVSVGGRRSVVALGAGVAAVTTGMLFAEDSPDGPGRSEVVLVAVVLGACWLVGWTLRERRAAAARAAAQATAQAVTDERLRIAREIHDIVGHSLSVIAVKAAVGSHVAGQRPEEAGAALRVIATTSRGALTELRRAVGALRTEADFAPPPTLAELPRLAERAGEAGVAVRLDVRGECEVPDGIALAAVRIVQESLTNVVKHAGPTTCRVDVLGVPGELRIEVSNDGVPVPPPAADGTGLTGMRERVALHAGSLVAGPREGGGFAVRAVLPYPDTALPHADTALPYADTA